MTAPVLYGFFWSDDVHESGAMLQSLHRSKRGALQAMIQAQAARWLACRSGSDSCLHTGLSRREQDYLTSRRYEAYAVRAVGVLA